MHDSAPVGCAMVTYSRAGERWCQEPGLRTSRGRPRTAPRTWSPAPASTAATAPWRACRQV